MISVCEEYCQARGVLFNSTKSVCVRFSTSKGRPRPEIKLGDATLAWADSVKHLGNTVHQNLKEDDEVAQKRGDLFGRVNAVLGTLKSMPTPTLLRVFEAQCCHLYGCQAWRLDGPAIDRMRTAFNRSLRRIMRLPPRTHRALLPLLGSCRPFDERILLRGDRMLGNMQKLGNEVGVLSRIVSDDSVSITSANRVVINKINSVKPSLVDISTAQAINDLMYNAPEGFTKEEAKSLAHFLCEY